jgi:N-acetylmuramoyl-L-alanine amidase
MMRLICCLLGLLALVSLEAKHIYRVDPQGGAYHRPRHAVASTNRISKQLIVLDAGHGGSDEGASMQSCQEKRVALSTTLMTKKQLEALGYRVLLTRSRDIYLSLPRRVSIANKAQGALFVSIHYNASRSKAAQGIEVYYPSTKELWRSHASKRLANCILHYLLDETEALSRGVKEGNFHVIRETEMPAVLVEGGFITNQDERTLLKDRDYLNRIAKGIAQGIDKYLKS